jgi:hypothetical protein
MDQLLNIVKTVAPSIATAMGGPLAGMAVRTLSETLLGKPDGTQEELMEAAKNVTPDQMLALKNAENNFKLEMKKLDVDLERISAGDRDSARKMAMQNPRDWTPRALAGAITVGFFGVLMYMLMYGLPPAGGGEAMLVMLGTLGTAWGAVVSFYFGSSAGSRAKDEAAAGKK